MEWLERENPVLSARGTNVSPPPSSACDQRKPTRKGEKDWGLDVLLQEFLTKTAPNEERHIIGRKILRDNL